jgi:osmotically-inducible protein OsmY
MSVDATYVRGHLEEAFAREGETDVHVRVSGDRVVVTGTVATEARRSAVRALAHEVAGDLAVADQLTVLHCHEPDDEEHIP